MKSSERAFGLVFTAVFTLIGTWPMRLGGQPRLWALVGAAVFLATSMLRPRLLRALNAAWFRLGLSLHHIVNPVIMLIIYSAAVVPTGLVLKALGKDLLRLRRERSAASYWIVRTPPGPARGSMGKQF